MPVTIDTRHRRHDMVTHIEITIGDETVRHHFGRRVDMPHARKMAQHFLDILTGQPSEFSANAAQADGARS